MVGMFERFTDQARRVVVIAQEQARSCDHDWIGSEHLLLGLTNDSDTVAASALQAVGAGPAEVRAQVDQIVGRGTRPASGHIPFTPRAKHVLEQSLGEALRLVNDFIGTEHLLLGLLQLGDEDDAALRVLAALGVDRDQLRDAVSARCQPGSQMAQWRGPRSPSSTPHVVTIAFDTEDFDACREAASAADQPLQAWARAQLLAAAKRPPAEAETDQPE